MPVKLEVENNIILFSTTGYVYGASVTDYKTLSKIQFDSEINRFIVIGFESESTHGTLGKELISRNFLTGKSITKSIPWQILSKLKTPTDLNIHIEELKGRVGKTLLKPLLEDFNGW